MTLPASGTISMSNFNTELGQASNYAGTLSWINGLSKSGQVYNDFASYYSHAYYTRNMDGNCSNGNCTSNCNCGDHNCSNCIITGTVNCANCDAQSWLQTNCNCNCTYNCTTGTTSINCNCNCACDCNCTCFPRGTLVLMADLSWREISTIRVGEKLWSHVGPANVYQIEETTLTSRRLIGFADDSLFWPENHMFWAKAQGREHLWGVNKRLWLQGLAEFGGKGLKDPDDALIGNVGDAIKIGVLDGWKDVVPLHRIDAEHYDLPLYMPLVDNGGIICVNGYLAASATNEWLCDYKSFRWQGLDEATRAHVALPAISFMRRLAA